MISSNDSGRRMTLSACLEDWQAEDTVWCSGSQSVSAGALREAISRRGRATFALGDVAVRIRDPLTLARTLLCLDGACRQMVLVPPSLGEVAARCLVEAAGCATLICDEPAWLASSQLPVIVPEALFDGPASASAKPSVQTRWLIASSGTTGNPKLVAHTLASLTDHTGRDPRRGRAYRWALFYDLTRMAGLQVFLQALCAASTLELMNSTVPLEVNLQRASTVGVNAISATPSLWRKMLMTRSLRELPLKQITLGGEIANASTLESLRLAFPAARITHIYASTEVGVGFVVRDGREGFPASYLESPPGEVALRVDGDGMLWLRKDADFVATGDLVRLVGDRYVFLGRANGAINVGGNKVLPEEVERAVMSHPDVAHASVFARPSPITGSLVSASVVCRGRVEDHVQLKRALVQHCAARLESFKVPALLEIVPFIEVSATGKAVRARP